MTRSPFGINGRTLSVWRICLVKSDFNAARAKPVCVRNLAVIIALMCECISGVIANELLFEHVRDTCSLYAPKVRSLCFSIVYFRFCSFATKTFCLSCFHNVRFIIHAASVHIRMSMLCVFVNYDICLLKNLCVFLFWILRFFGCLCLLCKYDHNEIEIRRYFRKYFDIISSYFLSKSSIN